MTPPTSSPQRTLSGRTMLSLPSRLRRNPNQNDITPNNEQSAVAPPTNNHQRQFPSYHYHASSPRSSYLPSSSSSSSSNLYLPPPLPPTSQDHWPQTTSFPWSSSACPSSLRGFQSQSNPQYVPQFNQSQYLHHHEQYIGDSNIASVGRRSFISRSRNASSGNNTSNRRRLARNQSQRQQDRDNTAVASSSAVVTPPQSESSHGVGAVEAGIEQEMVTARQLRLRTTQNYQHPEESLDEQLRREISHLKSIHESRVSTSHSPLPRTSTPRQREERNLHARRICTAHEILARESTSRINSLRTRIRMQQVHSREHVEEGQESQENNRYALEQQRNQFPQYNSPDAGPVDEEEGLSQRRGFFIQPLPLPRRRGEISSTAEEARIWESSHERDWLRHRHASLPSSPSPSESSREHEEEFDNYLHRARQNRVEVAARRRHRISDLNQNRQSVLDEALNHALGGESQPPPPPQLPIQLDEQLPVYNAGHEVGERLPEYEEAVMFPPEYQDVVGGGGFDVEGMGEAEGEGEGEEGVSVRQRIANCRRWVVARVVDRLQRIRDE